MVKAAFLALLAATGPACSPFGGASIFNCETDSQCTPNGMCKMPEGLCTFPSAACPDGEYGPHSGSLSGTCVGDEPPLVDAAIDAPTMCTANEKSCFNHAVETCNATGTGFDPALREPCAITCTTSGVPACVGAASNIALADQQACNAMGNALALTPAAGATVTINQADITCAPMCNAGGTTTIPRTTDTPNSFFCLSVLTLPAGVTVNVAAGLTSGVTLFSHAAVTLDADISFDGGNATGTIDGNVNNDLPGAGGPGGFSGGALNPAQNTNGTPGGGPGTCGGRGGTGQNTSANRDGGGGGGGGNVAVGGDGGDGRDGAASIAAGGAGGTITGCSTADARPLAGGAGGGSGADGACGGSDPCGWPGGGGGGALHVVSRSMISGAGVVSASGGAGFGIATGTGGGGGGGAGGMLLLEAPTFAFTGTLRVDGGNGGRSSTIANGGAGATAGTVAGTAGTDSPDANSGGPGGGGAGGRIRINATTGASCAAASPSGSCTTDTLRTAP